MRAIQQHEFGGPEVLQLVDLPTPEPGDGELLIRVSRAGMNFADTHQRRNDYLAAQQLPLVPGGEVAGVREDTGERVVALCGTGGYAEYATAAAALTFPIPDGVDDATALALLIQGMTAWHLYRTCGRVGEGESVVVVAGAGGVGSLAVQLGRPMGAGRVIAIASTQAKRDLTLQLGADAAVDTDPEGLKERLEEANGGRKVDVVFEMSGGPVFEACLAALAAEGYAGAALIGHVSEASDALAPITLLGNEAQPVRCCQGLRPALEPTPAPDLQRTDKSHESIF